MGYGRFRNIIYGTLLVANIFISNCVPLSYAGASPLEAKLEQEIGIDILGETTETNLAKLEIAYSEALAYSDTFQANSELINIIDLSSYSLDEGEKANASALYGLIRIDPENIFDYLIVHETAHLRYAAHPEHENKWNSILPVGHFDKIKELDIGNLYSKYDSDEEIALVTTEIFLLKKGYGTGLFPLLKQAGGGDLIKAEIYMAAQLGYISYNEASHAISSFGPWLDN